MTFLQWLNDYYQNRQQTERLGQAFENDFIKHPWSELFYEEDQNRAMEIIMSWLMNHQYYVVMPEKIK